MTPLEPLAQELLSGLDEDTLTFPAAHLAKIQAAVAALSEVEVAPVVQDCMRIAHVLEHEKDAPDAAASIESMCTRALTQGNERHGRMDRVSERQAQIGYTHRNFEGTDRALPPTEDQPKAKLTAQDIRPDLLLRRA